MHGRSYRVVTLLAIYAVALRVILLGLVPINIASANAVDPFSVICHSTTGAGQAGHQAPGKSGLIPGRACEHCDLCNAIAPPEAPDYALAGTMAPARIIHVLRPHAAVPRRGVTSEPRLARGPPPFA